MVWTLSRVVGVPDGHIVHFILDAVEQLPITDFRVNDRGTGSEQYPPRMGFRRFSLRGHAKVSLEWTLVCVSYNLKRLFTLKNLATAA